MADKMAAMKNLTLIGAKYFFIFPTYLMQN